jgi:hypothetical protein
LVHYFNVYHEHHKLVLSRICTSFVYNKCGFFPLPQPRENIQSMSSAAHIYKKVLVEIRSRLAFCHEDLFLRLHSFGVNWIWICSMDIRVAERKCREALALLI